MNSLAPVVEEESAVASRKSDFLTRSTLEPFAEPVRENAEALRTAVESISLEIRNYLDEKFKSRFTRFVSAEEARIFSVHGEVCFERQETEDSDSNEDDSNLEKD